MEFEPIDATRMVVLMVAGGVFACVGLYMMLRPKPQGSAKIELFGLKFESSSAGLLVFVIGAGFLAANLFVPVEGSTTSSSSVASSTAGSIATSNSAMESAGEIRAVVQPASADAKEVEPNGSKESAMPLRVGQVVKATISEDDLDGSWDSDWYYVDLPSGTIGQHEVKLRLVAGQTTFVKVFNERDELIKEVSTRSGAVYHDLKGQRGDRVYLLVQRNLLRPIVREYELSVEKKQAG